MPSASWRMASIAFICGMNSVRSTSPAKVTSRSSSPGRNMPFMGFFRKPSSQHGDDLLQHRVVVPGLLEQFAHAERLEPAGLQVDDVHGGLGVVLDHLGHDVDPQVGLPGADHEREVPAHAVHRPGAQAGHHADDAVLPPEPGRPAELVVAEGHAGEGREEVLAHLPAHHLLDDDAHLLHEVQQAALGPVLHGVGPEHRGVDFGHGVDRAPPGGPPGCRCWPGTGCGTCRRRPCPRCPPAGWRSAR